MRNPTHSMWAMGLGLWLVASAAAFQTGESAQLSLDQANQWLQEARPQVESLPADAAPDTPEARRRTTLERRIALLEEYIKLFEDEVGFTGPWPEFDKRLNAARAALEGLADETTQAIEPPQTTTAEGFKTLGDQLGLQRDELGQIRKTQTDAQQRLEAVPALVAEARARAEEARKRGEIQSQEANTATDEAAKQILSLRASNASIDQQVALQKVKTLEAEQQFRQAQIPVLQAELQVAEARLTRLEAEYEAYSAVREAELALEAEQMQGALEQAKEEAQTARTPQEQFTSSWQFLLAESRASKGRLETLKVNLNRDVEEQTRRRDNGREELAALRDFIDRSQGAPQAVERVRQTFQQIPQRRAALERAGDSGAMARTDELRSRRFAVEDALFGLTGRFNDERQVVLEQLGESQQEAFRQATAGLADEYRAALQDEKVLLTEVIGLATKFELALTERQATLDELERFIRSAVFWLRDTDPVGVELFRAAGLEAKAIPIWASEVTSADTRTALTDAVTSATGGGVLLAIVALPVVIVLVLRRLRRAVGERNERAAATSDATIGGQLIVVLLAVIRAALPLAYCLLVARLIATADLPETIGPVLRQILVHLGWFTSVVLLSRSLFGARGIAVTQFGMDARASRSLHRALRVVMYGYVTILLVRQILIAPPFELEALARLAYTLYGVLVGATVAWLLRPGSPFVDRALLPTSRGFIARQWGLLSIVIALAIVAIISLDVAGFRYAAGHLATAMSLTLITVIVLMAANRGAQAALAGALERWRATEPAEADDEGGTEIEHAERARSLAQIPRFVRLAFMLVGALLVAAYWGIDQQALRTLEDIHLYTVRTGGDADEFLTAADALRALVYVVMTVWILRALPGIYEYAIFPRFKLDDGLKYAILTISRYSLFTLGIFLVLAEIHLDLTRLGWLIAAMGVGLGFGLQEIVSNFVSGIILLIERPVRVGDTVTVGNVSGTVTRINIRATSIQNFDRREVLLPNRSLITGEVTNWTRGDSVNRLVISMGVAYGSDVQQVSDMLLEIAKGDPDVLEDPAPSVIFMNHGESSLDFDLRVFTSPSVMMGLRDRLNKEINRRFTEADIEIPFPQRDLHIRTMPVKIPELSVQTAEPKPDAKAKREAAKT